MVLTGLDNYLLVLFESRQGYTNNLKNSQLFQNVDIYLGLDSQKCRRLHANLITMSFICLRSQKSNFGTPIVSLLRMRDSYTNPYETKRIESFEIFGLTKRIHETNLLKIASRNESAKRIFWKLRHETNPQNESFENGWIRDPRYDTNPGFVIKKRNEPFWSQDSWSRNESMDSRNESTFLRISYTNPASLVLIVLIVLYTMF